MVPVSKNQIFLRFHLLFSGEKINLNLTFAVAAFRVQKHLRNIGFLESSEKGKSSKYGFFRSYFSTKKRHANELFPDVFIEKSVTST